VIPHVFLRRVMPMHALDEAEVEVFRFWVDRLQREYREPKTEFNEQVSVRFYYL
jgi:hypothetical protein